jgi:hypothetical protein
MKKIIFTLSILVSVAYAFGQGLKLDSANYLNTNVWQPPRKLGYSNSELPKSMSLRQYCPGICNQGEVASCVGWAVAYAGLTTAQNAKMLVTDYYEKRIRAFDAQFLYGLIKSIGDSWCQEGASLKDGLDVLLEYGCKPDLWEPWFSCNERGKYNDYTLAIASFNSINQYNAVPIEPGLETVKMAITYDLPVVIGVNLTESFKAGSSVNKGVWSPKPGEMMIGGHAMCVVGYDDNKYGGAFEVMNSWGEEYGDEGFIWIKYSDFYNQVQEAYIFDVGDLSTGSCSIGNCYEGYGRKKYENGWVYEGYFESGAPSVYGACLYPNKCFYIGQWKEGMRHGQGILFDSETAEFVDVEFRYNKVVDFQAKGFASEKKNEQIEQLHSKVLSSFPNAKYSATINTRVREKLLVLENEVNGGK